MLRRSTLLRALATAGAVLATVCTQGTNPAAAAKTGTHGVVAATQRLQAALRQLVSAQGGPPGVIAIVQRGSRRTVLTAGTAVVDSSTRLSANDHIRLASVSKAFSGAVALALVQNGKLSLGSTIGQVLPGLPAAWSAVTLTQLLDHTSGLPDYSSSPGFQEAIQAAPTVAPPPEQLLSYVRNEPLRFAAGSRYRYSNSDNVAVGLMAQAVTGQPYTSALNALVYTPLGLTSTSLPPTAAMPSPYVHGYDVQPSGASEDASQIVAPGWSWASGGLVSTPADANRFIRGYARGFEARPAVRARQFRFVEGGRSSPPGPGVNSAGLGIFRYQTSCGTLYGHTGNIFGYTNFVAATADGSRSVVVSANAQLSGSTDRARAASLQRVFLLAVCAATAR